MTAPLRQRRTRAALALQDAPRRAQLGWADLGAWPDWAGLPDAERDRLLWRTGAWCEAARLCRCIDGAVLKRLVDGLGTPALERLLASDATGATGATGDAAPPTDAAPLDPATLDAELQRSGRECALAALPSALLGVVLRERLWPDTRPPLPAIASLRAQQALQQAATP